MAGSDQRKESDVAEVDKTSRWLGWSDHNRSVRRLSDQVRSSTAISDSIGPDFSEVLAYSASVSLQRRGFSPLGVSLVVGILLALHGPSHAQSPQANTKPWLPTRTVECPHCGHAVPTADNSWPILLLGFAGQGAFGARFVIQWIASERAKTSVIPELFWWFSMTGGVLLFFYGWAILAWPILIGQGLNCLIYGRNLVFVRRSAANTETGRA